MVQVKREQKEQIKTEWSDSEMEVFDREIEFYRIEDISAKTNKLFKYFSVGAELKYLEDKGIIKVQWLKPWQEIRVISQIPFTILKLKDYEEFQKKLQFYWDWKSNKDLGSFGL